MFKGLGQLAGLMKYLQDPSKLAQELEAFKQRLGEITAEGDAGGGMVRVRANGRYEIVSVALGDDALRSGDRELLEDLVKAAANQALERARDQVGQESAKMTAALGVPAGFSLPGLGAPDS